MLETGGVWVVVSSLETGAEVADSGEEGRHGGSIVFWIDNELNARWVRPLLGENSCSTSRKDGSF